MRACLPWGDERGWHGNGLSDALVGSSVIEVVDVFADPAQELPFAENEPKVQALPAQIAQEPLAYRVRTRSGDRRVNDLDPGARRDPVESGAIFAVMAADE